MYVTATLLFTNFLFLSHFLLSLAASEIALDEIVGNFETIFYGE